MTPPSRSTPRVKSSLLTLGSAAVVAVYAAGFYRTRAAAQRFSEIPDLRRPVAPADTQVAQLAGASIASSPTSPVVADTSVATPAGQVRPEKRRAPVPPPADTAGAQTDTAIGVAAPLPVPPVTPPSAPADTAPHPADSLNPVAVKPAPQWRDGTYLGWGTSRHGDIEASVEIKDGRIVSATITQCLTRYSCSWISRLPGQVLDRQSARVDYVSGATQSSDAFYQAITEALTKAK